MFNININPKIINKLNKIKWEAPKIKLLKSNLKKFVKFLLSSKSYIYNPYLIYFLFLLIVK